MMSRKDGFLALLVVVVWGLNFVVIKVGLHHMPPLLLAGIRQSFDPAFAQQAVEHSRQCAEIDRQHFFKFNRGNTSRAAYRAQHFKLCCGDIQRR